MTEPIRIDDLDVIGFADTLAPELLPRAVPPIFRLRQQPECVILPPYRLGGSLVFDAFATTPGELARAVERGQATQFEDALAARPEHILWIDADGRRHYEPEREAAERLRHHAREWVHAAAQELVQATHAADDKALRLAQAAISADETCLDALLVKAFVLDARGEGLTETLAQIAAAVDPHYDFRARLAEFGDEIKGRRFRHGERVPSRRFHARRPLDAVAAAA